MKGKLEELTIDEINKILKDSKEKIFQLRFKSITGKVENTKEIKELKKKIARILTLKRENELGIRKK